MKKYIVLIILTFAIFMTGCNSNDKTSNKEVKTSKIVYCSNCSAESNEITKFCSNCGVEAKWVPEKPKTEDNSVKEQGDINKKDKSNDKKETKRTNEKKIDAQDPNVEYVKCILCGKEEASSNLNHVHGYGYVHKSCYNNAKKCEQCNRSLLPGDDDNSNGICLNCEGELDECLHCGGVFPKSELVDFYEGKLCSKCNSLEKNCANGFYGVCEGCDRCAFENNQTN